MELELSQKTEKIAKAAKISCETMVFTDLVAVGWEPTDAYIAAFRKGATWVKKALKAEVEKLLAAKPVQERMASVRKIVDSASQSNREIHAEELLERATNKEKKLISLQQILETLPQGSKEYNKINDQIFAITQMKKDEVSTDDKTVHYHLPVAYPTGCHDCLYSRCDQCKYKKKYATVPSESPEG